jgi:hypothetical protein
MSVAPLEEEKVMKALGMAVLTLLMGAEGFAQAPAPIFGDYVEARSGHVHTCGCLYSGEQVTEGKEAILAWAFRGGEFGGAPLAGIRVVAVIIGDGNLGLEGTSRRSVLYFDSGSSNAQRSVTLELLGREYGSVLGSIMSVHAAPIAFLSRGDTLQASVGDTISIVTRKAQIPEDAHLGSSTWYGPFVPMTESVLSTTLHFEYKGKDFNRQWWHRDAGITGYLGSFTLTP